MTLAAACALTVAAETGFFLLLGYRDRMFAAACVCANVATNLSLNLLLWRLTEAGAPAAVWIYPLESAAVLAEYAVYAALRGPSWKLFGLTAAANAISYGLGLVIYGPV